MFASWNKKIKMAEALDKKRQSVHVPVVTKGSKACIDAGEAYYCSPPETGQQAYDVLAQRIKNSKNGVSTQLLKSSGGDIFVVYERFAQGSFGTAHPVRKIGQVSDTLYVAKRVALTGSCRATNQPISAAAVKADLKQEVQAMYGKCALFPHHILETDLAVYLLMMPMQGDAADFLAQYRFNPEARRLFAHTLLNQVSEQVAWIHGAGFSHRDIKLENILVKCDGNIILGDFGLALPQEKISGRSGTHDALAPETFGWNQRKTRSGSKADVWALGLAVMEVLVGSHIWGNSVWADPASAVKKVDHAEHQKRLILWGQQTKSVLRDLRDEEHFDLFAPAAGSLVPPSVSHFFASEPVGAIWQRAFDTDPSVARVGVFMLADKPKHRPTAKMVVNLCGEAIKGSVEFKHLRITPMGRKESAVLRGLFGRFTSQARKALELAAKDCPHPG